MKQLNVFIFLNGFCLDPGQIGKYYIVKFYTEPSKVPLTGSDKDLFS